MKDVWVQRIEAIGKILIALAAAYFARSIDRGIDEWKTDNEQKRVFLSQTVGKAK